MRLTFSDVQRNVAEIANRESYDIDVLFELLAAYGRAASSITKLRNGTNNLAEHKNKEVLQRDVVYFKAIDDESKLHSTIETLTQDPLVVRYNPRYLIVTNYDRLVAIDTKKDTRLDIHLRDIDRYVDFFYGWTGDEVTDEKTEAVADRRAADKMKDLYAEIEKVNGERLTDPSSNFRHDLNVFFSRLLFCFFAEDTRVFSRDEPAMFTNAIKDYTQTDGSDLDSFLETLFRALDTEDKSGFTSPFSKFPYVNGTIFDAQKHKIGIPKFNAQARKLILDCGNQDWSEINPDIFGSMFQSIVDSEQRANHGQHYTSVPNIMKTIEPLFLDELRDEFDKNYDNPKKLEKLWDRISKIKIFDPACGSGNFLIIAYKELRKVEHAIIERLYGDEHKRAALAGKLTSQIKLDNFYGIEIDDFPHEIAILSLYLAKHQMNIEFEKQFGREIKLIPLKDNANIICDNAARIDWNQVCPNFPNKSKPLVSEQTSLIELENSQSEFDLANEHWEEIYLISNPPYSGARKQTDSQKADLDYNFSTITTGYRNMDYVAIWFYKATQWLGENDKAAFSLVSVNSISQGQQIGLVWPLILNDNIHIDYAYTSFKWENSAKDKAGVSCVIIAMSRRSIKNRFIQTGSVRKNAIEISPYLSEKSNSSLVTSRSQPISQLPKMEFGNMPLDGGNLLLNTDEVSRMLSSYPEAKKFTKRIYGAREFINGIERWCIWILPQDLNEAMAIPAIAERVNRVREFRLKSKDRGTQLKSAKAYSFREQKTSKFNTLIVPGVSSENREYIPIGVLNNTAVVSNLAQAIYDPEPWVFAILTSKMHRVWLDAVGGKHETRVRYSKDIVYNNFPMRPLLNSEKAQLAQLSTNVLMARENHTEMTLAEMYDVTKIPMDLRQAHRELDLAVDMLYRLRPYNNDEERLADLFTLYEQMTEKENAK